ncbi:MAG: aspartate aminotransferase family protein [Deltaproteobacteria bacterium]|nr:aspartate aminotransferase family protein [Deltaproteobacteria bacterium]
MTPTTSAPIASSEELRARESAHLTPGLQHFAILAGRAMAKGRGSKLWDVEGREYIDFIGGIGVNALGHCHPKYVKAIQDQAEKLTVGSFTSEPRVKLLELLAKVLPKHLSHLQLYSGGTEAVEAAMRLAKSHTKKWEFLSFWGGFHGKTMGTMAMMGTTAKQGLGPFPPGNLSAPYANCYRCPFKLKYPSCGMLCAEFARDAVKHQSAGALAAIVVEPMQGTAGNVIPPKEWLPALASIAKEFGALLIADEMITGFGRTGTMFASPELGVQPDIMTLGKGIASGFPLSALAARPEISGAKPYAAPSGSSSSYGGNPLAAAAALASVSTIVDEDLAANSRRQGEKFLTRLNEWKDKFPFVGEVRGKGLFLAMELVSDRETKAPLSKEKTEKLYQLGVAKGILSMSYAAAVRFQPALNITDDELSKGLDLLEETLTELSRSA